MFKKISIVLALIAFGFSSSLMAMPKDCEVMMSNLQIQYGQDEDDGFELVLAEIDDDVEGKVVGYCGSGYKVVYQEVDPS
ncbi:MAG: hypothetical protein MK096_09105 [Oleiphilaceae bacterium]|nr:hypothetical protein [Oleiphilaceae bacterium]